MSDTPTHDSLLSSPDAWPCVNADIVLDLVQEASGSPFDWSTVRAADLRVVKRNGQRYLQIRPDSAVDQLINGAVASAVCAAIEHSPAGRPLRIG